MKKTITILLTVFILLTLLASCSQLLGDTLEEPDEPSPPVETPEGGDKPDPTEPEPEPEPTGVDEYGFTIWPEGNYLADPKFDTDEFLPDYDVDNNYALGVYTQICTTEDSIYTLVNDHVYADADDIRVLMYTDRATKITMPLCGRPECTHDNTSCNAYIGASVIGLRVYDGKLWWVDNSSMSSTLRRMDLDGTNHETVERIDSKLASYSYLTMIHRGYVYVPGCEMRTVDGKAMDICEVVAKPLDGGDTITILQQPHPAVANTPEIYLIPVRNDIFIVIRWLEPEEGDDETVIHTELYRWSSKTRKAEQIYDDVDNPEYLHCRECRPYPVADDGLYFVSSKSYSSDDAPPITMSGGSQSPGYIREYALNRLSFETGKIEEISSFNVMNSAPQAVLTRDYIIAEGHTNADEEKVFIFDHNGELVLQADLQKHLRDTYAFTFCGGDGENVYIRLDGLLVLPSRILVIPLDGGETYEIAGTVSDLNY